MRPALTQDRRTSYGVSFRLRRHDALPAPTTLATTPAYLVAMPKRNGPTQRENLHTYNHGPYNNQRNGRTTHQTYRNHG